MAKAGHVTGGRVFGYDNHRTERGHVERRINEAEAEVVRRIFTLARDGAGLRAIAKRLNPERVPAPRAQQGRPKAWAPSSVRELLHRPLYHGIIIWGRTKKRDQWGQARRRARPASGWLAVPAPQLRIVPEDLWRAVHGRLENARLIYVRSTNGQLWGRPPSGVAPKHLLAGLARCGACGGSLVAVSRAHGTGKQRRREHQYACSSFHLRGSSVGPNGLEVRMSAADDAVLAALERDVLDAELIDGVVQRVLSRMQPAAEACEAQRASLEGQLRTIESEIARFTDAIAAGGGNVASVVAALKSRDDRRQELVRELEGL